MKYYFSPLFIAGFALIITGLVVFLWLPVVGIGAVALFIDWVVRRSELSKSRKWMLLSVSAGIFMFFLYSMIGLRSSLSGQNINY